LIKLGRGKKGHRDHDLKKTPTDARRRIKIRTNPSTGGRSGRCAGGVREDGNPGRSGGEGVKKTATENREKKTSQIEKRQKQPTEEKKGKEDLLEQFWKGKLKEGAKKGTRKTTP